MLERHSLAVGALFGKDKDRTKRKPCKTGCDGERGWILRSCRRAQERADCKKADRSGEDGYRDPFQKRS